jgi:hypothetical protein
MIPMRWTLLLLMVLTASCSQPKFSSSDCIRNTIGGYIYRVNEVHGGDYAVQGWLGGRWGITTNISTDVLDERYAKIACPVSTETLPNIK